MRDMPVDPSSSARAAACPEATTFTETVAAGEG
jgi:hypothetical protein